MNIIVNLHNTVLRRLRQVGAVPRVLAICVVLLGAVYLTSGTAFRRRFDALSIGMPRYRVIQLIGDPSFMRYTSQSRSFTPNYSECLYREDGAIIHTKYGAVWKHYFLYGLGQGSSYSDTWHNDSQEIVVYYDHKRHIKALLWFEWQEPLTPWLAKVYSTFGIYNETVYENASCPI